MVLEISYSIRFFLFCGVQDALRQMDGEEIMMTVFENVNEELRAQRRLLELEKRNVSLHLLGLGHIFFINILQFSNIVNMKM